MQRNGARDAVGVGNVNLEFEVGSLAAPLDAQGVVEPDVATLLDAGDALSSVAVMSVRTSE